MDDKSDNKEPTIHTSESSLGYQEGDKKYQSIKTLREDLEDGPEEVFSKSKKTLGQRKNWIFKPQQNNHVTILGIVKEAFVSSIYVEIMGKENAPKTKLTHESAGLVSRMPDRKNSSGDKDKEFDGDLSKLIYDAKDGKIDDKSSKLPDSFISALAFKMIMGDSDIKLENFVEGYSRKVEGEEQKRICFPIDAEASFEGRGSLLNGTFEKKQKSLRDWSYEDFDAMVKEPKKFVSYSDPSLDIEGINTRTRRNNLTKDQKIKLFDYLEANVTPEKIINAFEEITDKIKENNYELLDKIAGTLVKKGDSLEGKKGILPDIQRGNRTKDKDGKPVYDTLNLVYAATILGQGDQVKPYIMKKEGFKKLRTPEGNLDFNATKLPEVNFKDKVKESVELFSGFVKKFKLQQKQIQQPVENLGPTEGMLISSDDISIGSNNEKKESLCMGDILESFRSALGFKEVKRDAIASPSSESNKQKTFASRLDSKRKYENQGPTI